MEWMRLPWQEVALFDDAFPKLQVGPRERPVVGTLKDGIAHCASSGLLAMVALGSKVAALRYATYRKLNDSGVRLPSLIHPSCLIAPSARLGNNVILMPGCVIGSGVTVGSMCCLFSSVTIEHDTVIGDNVVFGPGVVVSGFVHVGQHAFIGTGATCAPEVRIGERALIGAGAVVVSDVPLGKIAIGVPARVHRDVPEGYDAPTLSALRQLGCET